MLEEAKRRNRSTEHSGGEELQVLAKEVIDQPPQLMAGSKNCRAVISEVGYQSCLVNNRAVHSITRRENYFTNVSAKFPAAYCTFSRPKVVKHSRYFDWLPMKSSTARLKSSGCSQ